MHGFGFGIGGFMGMVLVWILLIVGSVWLIKVLFSGDINKSSGNNNQEEQAIEILNKRYARGELTKEEYVVMKKDLAG
ncbi:MAG: SHOCT domain-containing protein [Candidatus Heimdallarchaeota archaeon]|nr:SHOCT domain-containing protein [Candidatus Heimdallarchaeota archaeon]